ncbi:MAG TPA: ABC transporter permease [Chloroflexia bacterium]|nr:ABC transporter permease [Chloroflexia bacterium]
MRKVWAVVKRQLLETAKRPRSFIFNLILPIILIVVIGQMFNFSTTGDKVKVSLPVVFEDSATTIDQTPVLASLTSIPGLNVTLEVMSLAEAKDHVTKKLDRSGYVIVPAGFTKNLAEGQPAALQVYTTNDSGGQIIQSLIQSSASYYNTTNLLVKAETQQSGQGQSIDRQAATRQALQLQQNTPPAIKVEAQTVAGASFNQFDQVAPGYATMFVIFGLNTVVLAILDERSRGTMRRLAVMPLSKWQFMAGKMIAQFLVSFLQVSLMLLAAKLLFNANINADNVAGIVLVVTALSFAATALGMLLVSIFKSENAVSPVVTLVALIGSAVGGAWFPLFLMPDWIQEASKVSINSWAMRGFNGLMIFGQNLSEVLPNILALFAYGLICLVLATRFFRYSEV